MEINSTHLLVQTVRAVAAAWPKGRTVEDVVSDLRYLRFDDQGVLALVDAIIDGRLDKIEELRLRLAEFNDHEWRVADTAARLADRCPRISNLTHEEIQLIVWRKPSIRRDLQGALNHWDQPRARIDLARLKEVRQGITDFNRAIDEAEDKLLHGTRR